MKPIEIRYRKLGKEKAHGLAWCEDGLIEIDTRVKGYNLLYTLIHEIIHVQCPTWSEIRVEGHSKQMTELLWEQGIRKVDL